MIRSLVHSIGLDNDRMLLLETFRVKRNAIDYSGDEIDEASAEECIDTANDLFRRVSDWLARNRPDLL